MSEGHVKLFWSTSVVVLSLFIILQSIDLISKQHTISTLHVFLHPELIEYAYTEEDQPKQLPVYIPHAAMTAEWLDDQVYNLYSDSDWGSLFPAGNGWVTLGPNSTYYVLSMYHQIHCLDAMRYAYVAAKAGALSFPGNGTDIDHHMNHCLTYLREALLCAADTTLEVSYPYINSFGEKDHGATGMGMVHQCKDWTKIRDYLEENYDARIKSQSSHKSTGK